MCAVFSPQNSGKTAEASSPGRVDVASIRREQIIEAAVQIIVEQGLPNLSLSRIEEKVRMKRGQLTYYFPTKESILLAVFDRLLLLLFKRISEAEGKVFPPDPHETRPLPPVWDCVQKMLQMTLGEKPLGPEFHALQFTFLAQIAHREDFRQKLASLYEEWRVGLAIHWQVSIRPPSPLGKEISPRALASFIQAVLHGLTVQLAADPNAFDRNEMLELCVGILAPFFVISSSSPTANEPPAKVKPRSEKSGRKKEPSDE